ncbi:MAG: NrsF family protein, partial [Pseudomonadota bacterium]
SPLPVELVALLWLASSAAFVMAITHLFGPIRPNALHQLATEPRFLFESVLGIVAITYTAIVSFRCAIPGAASKRSIVTALGLLALWLANYIYGLSDPALEPSMEGKRPHCLWETMMFAAPPAVLAYLITRRLYPLKPVRSAMLFSLVAGMLPALYIQIASMYAPKHIIQMHILPGFLVMLAGGAIVWFLSWLKQRRQ